MKEIKYCYALDSNGIKVNICDVDESRRHDVFTCIGCGAPIIPKIAGKIRQPHFCHKEVKCSPETYLHKLAKKLIKEKFDSGELLMTLPAEVICSEKDNCMFYDEDYCGNRFLHQSSKTFNLCDSFDTCEEEKAAGLFVGDLVLSRTNSDTKLLIEIYVEHECEPEKWASDYRIIETKKIVSEQQIIDIVTNGFSVNNSKFSDKFKTLVLTEKLKSDHMHRFAYFQSGKAMVKSPFPTGDLEEDMKGRIDCENLSNRIYPRAVIELNINGDYLGAPNVYEIGYMYLLKHNQIKNCAICKYEEDHFCRLCYKFNTPSYVHGPEAEKCQYFRAIQITFDPDTRVQELK